MANLFLRAYRLFIGGEDGIETSELRISFEIEKSLVGFPNLGRIVVYNLSETNRNKIKDEYSEVILYAGYEGKEALLFKGELRNVNHQKIGVDWVTEIFAGDGAKALETSKINKSFVQGTTTDTLFKELVKQLPGVSTGSLDGIKECISKKRSILKTALMSGSVKEFLDLLADNCGFDYSVNDGTLDTVPKNKAIIDTDPYLINQGTGMIGSPEVTEIGAKVSTLLRPEIKTGRLMEITAISAKINVGNQFFREVTPTITGRFKIQKIKHIGDSRDGEWKTELEGVKLG